MNDVKTTSAVANINVRQNDRTPRHRRRYNAGASKHLRSQNNVGQNVGARANRSPL